MQFDLETLLYGDWQDHWEGSDDVDNPDINDEEGTRRKTKEEEEEEDNTTTTRAAAALT